MNDANDKILYNFKVTIKQAAETKLVSSSS